MSGPFNAIWVGYPFSQDFTVPAGTIPAEATLWLPLRRMVAPRTVAIARVELERLSPTSFRMALDAGATAALRPGLLTGDLRIEIGGVSQPLGVRLTIPVEEAL